MEKYTCSKEDCKKAFKDVKHKLGEYREFNGKLYDDIDSLENDIREKDKFASKLSRERNKLQEELKIITEELEVKNKDLDIHKEDLKKQKETSQKFFLKIMSENRVLKEQLEEASEREKDFQNDCRLKDASKGEVFAEVALLEAEVKDLTLSNAEKEITLKRTEAEKNELVNQLEVMELEKNSIEAKVVVEHSTAKSLEEELCLSGFENKVFECKYCEETFGKRMELGKHVELVHEMSSKKNTFKLKLVNLKEKLHEQKINLVDSVLLLKKKENKEARKCKCQKFCRIHHDKHNFKKSKSEEIFIKFQGSSIKTFNCEQCDGEFKSSSALEMHIVFEHSN